MAAHRRCMIQPVCSAARDMQNYVMMLGQGLYACALRETGPVSRAILTCSADKCLTSIFCVVGLSSSYLSQSSASHTMSVSTAPMSRHMSVSLTPNTYLPLSWEISSKNLPMRRFSCKHRQRDANSDV